MVGAANNLNDETIEAWNTVLFEKFVRYRHLIVEGLGMHGSQVFRRFPPAAGARVLDIGCGFGDTTVQLARLVGVDGEVVGVDCAANFIAAGQALAQERAAGNCRFLCCDVQFADMDGPYDAAYSRFGTMFFNSPVAALKNIHRHLKPGGSLSMSVWRKRQDNPCFYTAQQVVEQFIDESDKATDQVTCGPGPFSMAGADMVSDQLLAAGFTDPQFVRFDAPLCIGHTIDEALNFARDIGPAGETMRLAKDKAALRWGEIENALSKAMEPFQQDNGIWATSSTWLINARA